LNILKYSIPARPARPAYWPHPAMEAMLSIALAMAIGLAIHYRRKARSPSRAP